MEPLKRNYQSPGVSAADTTAVFVVKSLLNPVVAVLSLAACLAVRGDTLHGP